MRGSGPRMTDWTMSFPGNDIVRLAPTKKRIPQEMAQHRLGIIMNGVTGRMGMNQHLIRSILAIRAQGGVALKNGDRVMPDPILVGRNKAKLAQLAKAHGLTRWTSDLNACLLYTSPSPRDRG